MDEPLLHGEGRVDRSLNDRILRPGHTNCRGCGMSVALNVIDIAVRETPVQIVIPACCGIVTAGAYPASAYGVPVVASTFASAPAVASGLARVAQMNGDRTRVMCWTGDGGTYDIGLATLSAAAERNEDILYFCYDNEIYGNTGGQRSSATPQGATTTTTASGKDVLKKDILGIMVAHRVPYVASLSLGHLDDAVRKLRHAIHARGFRFIHILSPCPPGWKSDPADGVALVRMAVRSGLYPVYEVFDGRRWQVNIEPDFDKGDLARYFELQARFRTVDLETTARAIADQWSIIRKNAAP